MSRKSRIEPVREYLLNERKKVIKNYEIAIQAEELDDAKCFLDFRRILSVAIQLCGEEKPKGVEIKGKGSYDPFGKEDKI